MGAGNYVAEGFEDFCGARPSIFSIIRTGEGWECSCARRHASGSGSQGDGPVRIPFVVSRFTPTDVQQANTSAMPCSEFVVSGMGRECSELSEFRNVFDCHSFTHGRRAVTQAKYSPIPDVSAFQFHEGHLAEARPPSA